MRASRFFNEWPVEKIKYILLSSSVSHYRMNQNVYTQQDNATEWYLFFMKFYSF